jgi:magnesium transporter
MNTVEQYDNEDMTALALASLANNQLDVLTEVLINCHPSEIALLFESVPVAQRITLLDLLTEESASTVLPLLQEDVRRQLLVHMEPPTLVAVADQMRPADLAEAMDSLPDELSDSLMQSLDAENRARVTAVLEYPEGFAGRMMSTDVLSVRPDVRLSVVSRWLRTQEKLPDYTSALMVTDKDGRYIGKLLMSAIVTGDPKATVESAMRSSSEVVRVGDSEDDIARLFDQRHLISVAVLDADDHLLGRITVDDAMSIIKQEADHRLLSSRGLSDEADLFAPILPSAKQRGLWLGINLATVFLAAWVIGQFQAALDQLVALAVLMPIVASMGGIAGSQTLTLTIRGLALNQVVKGNIRWLATKEIGVGALNGVVWAIVVALVTYLWFRNPGLSLVIGVAMVLNLLAAAVSGVAVPLTLKRMGLDPALSGAVVLTTVTDIVGFLSFLGLASLFLL